MPIITIVKTDGMSNWMKFVLFLCDLSIVLTYLYLVIKRHISKLKDKNESR